MALPTSGSLCPHCREYRNDPPGVNCFKPGQPCLEDTMTEQTMKRTPEQIVESALDGEAGTAFSILEIQNSATAFVEQFSDTNKGGYPPMWDVIEYHGIPRDFFELCQKIADYEVRL